MANDNLQRGLLPLNYTTAIRKAHYYRCSTAADIFLGQPVDAASTGYVVGIGTPTGVTLTIGVAVGFAGNLKSMIATQLAPYLRVSDLTPPTAGLEPGDRYAMVVDDPDEEWIVQEDTGGTALTTASAFEGFDLLYGGGAGPTNVTSGNILNGWAALELDRSTTVTTTGAFCQVVRLYERPNSDGTYNVPGNYAKWVVKLLHHRFKGANVAAPTV